MLGSNAPTGIVDPKNPYSEQLTKKRRERIMKLFYIVGAIALVAGTASAFSMSMVDSASSLDRRSFVKSSAALVAGTAAAPQLVGAEDYSDFTTTESGLKYKIIKEGDGAVPLQGQTVKAHYTGWLDDFDSIKKFDSSRDRGRPFSFKAGAGQVIRGWDESFLSMKVGERRKIIIPPRLGYGDRGAGGIIPGGATLYFDVELLAIQ
jgi:peptidylprolyl isomerase